MESTRSVLQQGELGDKPLLPPSKIDSSVKKDVETKKMEDKSPPSALLQQQRPRPVPKLALIPLIPLRPAISSKSNGKQQQQPSQQQQKPLEAKQFPIVLGRTDLAQWWYQSCSCHQYYCRLHCRPVAQNIGSLSKVMIQIDTKGTAHIVGKNPHLVTISSPERGSNSNSNNDANDIGSSSRKIKKEDDPNKNFDENKDGHLKPIVLRANDILSIGRRDREPWMRFQVVEITTSSNNVSSGKTKQTTTKSTNGIGIGISREATDPRQAVKNEASQEPPRQLQQARKTNHGRAKIQQGATANTTGNHVQQKNAHHDSQLPEWITTTTNMNTSTGKRTSRLSSSSSYNPNHNSTTDTKQQQHHQAMVATLTRAAAAAGAAGDADERHKSKKHYRYNSYYNYYNQSNNNYEGADHNNTAQQRKRRRHTTSSFAPYQNSKSLIRSAEELFYNGSFSRRGQRLGGHLNDPQIHLVCRDYETSARLIQAGTIQGRSKLRLAKEISDAGKNNDTNRNDESQQSPKRQRKRARTDRNFIGKPKQEEPTKTAVTATSSAIVCATTNEGCAGEKAQSKSIGLLSKNYAAALLEVSKPSVTATSEEANNTGIKKLTPPVILPGDHGFQMQRH